MTLTLLPAVDIADREVVIRVPADEAGATTYGTPRDAALAWQADGAAWIHLVDLDAAFGRGANAELLATITGELDVDVELSGGIRDDVSLQWALSTGCARVVLGTEALVDPAWCVRAIAHHGERIAVGLDVRIVERADGLRYRLTARGGDLDRGDLWDTLALLDRAGCARYVVTDVSKDGALQGPAIELYRSVTGATVAPVIASGGISTLDDLVALAEAAAAGPNLEGAILGTALYAGRFTLSDALEAVRRTG